MNILMIGTTDKRGGAAKVSWDIKEFLEKNGHTVNFFVADKKSNDNSVRVIPRCKIVKIINFILGTERFLRTDFILNTKEFKEADIIHCHNIHGRFFNILTLSKMSKIKPVVWTLHDEWAITPHCAFTFQESKIKDGFYVCPNKNIPPRILWHSEFILRQEKRSAYKKSKLNIVVPSKWLFERVKNSILGKKNLNLIYNGVDTNIFKILDKEKCKNKFNFPDNKKIILFLADGGSSNPWKGWFYAKSIIEKMKNRDELLFVCVGGDKSARDGNILYVPQINDQVKMAEFYNACDIFLYPSIADNFPLVILEAMATGLPVVSFDTGGIKEVLEHKENGYIARYKDVHDLERGLDYLLELSRNEKIDMILKSSKKINLDFTISDMANKYFSLYNEIIKKYEK